MPSPPPDPSDRTQGFGPNRHRMEIELMEKRFRERSERHGGGPVSTGEIDGKVSDEMRQFFDESTMTLGKVVPQLKEGDSGEEMLETTGEIRRKIDDFFSGVNEPGAPPAAPQASAAAAPPAPRARPSAPPPRVVAEEPPPSEPVAAPAPAPRASSAPKAAPAPKAPPESAAPEAGQMDLKTALEKLRRHGTAKGSDPVRPAAQRPASQPAAPAPAAPPRSASPAPAPARREAPPPAQPPRRDQAPQRPAAPARTQAPPPPPPREPSPMSHREPASSRTFAPRPAASSPVAPARRDPATFLPSDDSLPRPSQGDRADRAKQVSKLPPLSTDDIPVAPPPELQRLRPRATPDDVVASAPRRAPAEERRPAAEAKRPAAEAPRQKPSTGDDFDSIFDEVQGIVLGTLKVSVSETLAAARDSESELSQVAVPTAEPTSEIGPNSTSQRIERFARPEEDAEEEKDEEAPKGPYNWGVKPAAKPRGAWLLETPDAPPQPQAEAPPATVTSEILSSVSAMAKAAASVSPPSEPAEPSESAQSGGGGGGGARAYLVRKASDEVKRFQPVLRALREKQVLDESEIGAKAAPKSGSADEFMSAESFKDNRLTPEEIEQELSPMRLVEELRRLKRVTQALLDKGIISADDLKKAAEE